MGDLFRGLSGGAIRSTWLVSVVSPLLLKHELCRTRKTMKHVKNPLLSYLLQLLPPFNATNNDLVCDHIDLSSSTLQILSLISTVPGFLRSLCHPPSFHCVSSNPAFAAMPAVQSTTNHSAARTSHETAGKFEPHLHHPRMHEIRAPMPLRAASMHKLASSAR